MDRLSILLQHGLIIYTHYPEEYAYLGWPEENEDCLSYQISQEYLEENSIPISGGWGAWYELPDGTHFPEGI